jgi:DnaJ-class molecular chaperone
VGEPHPESGADVSQYTGRSVVDGLELEKRKYDRRTDYENCGRCGGHGVLRAFKDNRVCPACSGKGLRIVKQGKA